MSHWALKYRPYFTQILIQLNFSLKHFISHFISPLPINRPLIVFSSNRCSCWCIFNWKVFKNVKSFSAITKSTAGIRVPPLTHRLCNKRSKVSHSRRRSRTLRRRYRAQLTTKRQSERIFGHFGADIFMDFLACVFSYVAISCHSRLLRVITYFKRICRSVWSECPLSRSIAWLGLDSMLPPSGRTFGNKPADVFRFDTTAKKHICAALRRHRHYHQPHPLHGFRGDGVMRKRQNGFQTAFFLLCVSFQVICKLEKKKCWSGFRNVDKLFFVVSWLKNSLSLSCVYFSVIKTRLERKFFFWGGPILFETKVFLPTNVDKIWEIWTQVLGPQIQKSQPKY